MRPGLRPPPRRRTIPRFGCFAGLLFGLAVLLGVYALLAPWSFHIGGSWTPAAWWGTGTLRSTSGAQYRLLVFFSPEFRRGGGASFHARRTSLLHYDLRGEAWLCTPQGVEYRFRLGGDLSGVWLNTDGASTHFYFTEPRGEKLRRHFDLYGEWHGPNLVLDDKGTLARQFFPDGRLAPRGRPYTVPGPVDHATVTLSRSSYSAFKSVCQSQPPAK